jgi:hypothetical protein
MSDSKFLPAVTAFMSALLQIVNALHASAMRTRHAIRPAQSAEMVYARGLIWEGFFKVVKVVKFFNHVSHLCKWLHLTPQY